MQHIQLQKIFIETFIRAYSEHRLDHKHSFHLAEEVVIYFEDLIKRSEYDGEAQKLREIFKI